MTKEQRKLLKMRAIEMAKEQETTLNTTSSEDVIVFSLASESYGIESEFVREVYPLKVFTSLPGLPSHILGIINVRGLIHPIVDLKKFFNLPVTGLGELNKVIIIWNDEMEFGILADEVIGMKMINMEELLPVSSIMKGIGEKYLKGVTNDRLIVLSAEKLLSDKNIVINESVNQ